MWLGKPIQTDRQTDIWKYINGEVKSGSHFVKNDFSSNKPHYVHVQYVFNESAKYQNLSTNSSSQFDFTMHALYQLHQSIQNPVVKNYQKMAKWKKLLF